MNTLKDALKGFKVMQNNEKVTTEKTILRGEIFIADLSGAISSEQQGLARPVLIIQNNVGNHFSTTTIVLPITKVVKRNMPTHHPISAESCGLIESSIVLCEQPRTLDKVRIKQRIGRVQDSDMEIIDKRLALSLGLMSSEDFYTYLESK